MVFVRAITSRISFRDWAGLDNKECTAYPVIDSTVDCARKRDEHAFHPPLLMTVSSSNYSNILNCIMDTQILNYLAMVCEINL